LEIVIKEVSILKIIFSVLLLGALLSGCQESSDAAGEQPITSTEKQQDKQQETQQEQKQLPVEIPPVEQVAIIEPKPEPKMVEKAPEAVVLPAPEEASQPLDMTLDHETTETIRLGVPDIMDRPMELPDLFGKYEKQVIIKSRVLVDDKEGKALDKVDGAEIKLEMKVP
jgi:hypothetical protein